MELNEKLVILFIIHKQAKVRNLLEKIDLFLSETFQIFSSLRAKCVNIILSFKMY
jgi:hypothetical protein